MKMGRCFAHVEVVVETVVGGWRIEGGNLFGMDLISSGPEEFSLPAEGGQSEKGKGKQFYLKYLIVRCSFLL